MEKKVNVWNFVRTNIASILLTLYIVFSLIFIVRYFYVGVIRNIASNSYQQAFLDISVALQNAKCQPLPLNIGQAQVNIIDVTCVQKETAAPSAK